MLSEHLEIVIFKGCVLFLHPVCLFLWVQSALGFCGFHTCTSNMFQKVPKSKPGICHLPSTRLNPQIKWYTFCPSLLLLPDLWCLFSSCLRVVHPVSPCVVHSEACNAHASSKHTSELFLSLFPRWWCNKCLHTWLAFVGRINTIPLYVRDMCIDRFSIYRDPGTKPLHIPKNDFVLQMSWCPSGRR